MIQPLRALHRRGFVALAVVLPAILAVGLGSRRSRTSASEAVVTLPSSARLLKQSDRLWQKHVIQTEFYAAANREYVVLKPERELNEPDMLLYWTEDEVRGAALPVHAHFLGTLPGREAFLLPQNGGHLVLYSLAHQAAFDLAPVESLP
jgi:hypothetical protein